MLTASGRPRSSLAPRAVRPLAGVERLLHQDDHATGPAVTVGDNGAHVSWRSWELNEHARGSLTASVVNEFAATDGWRVATIHDPIEDSDNPELVVSTLTAVYDQDLQSGGGAR